MNGKPGTDPFKKDFVYDNSYLNEKLLKECHVCHFDLSNLLGGFSKCPDCKQLYCKPKCGLKRCNNCTEEKEPPGTKEIKIIPEVLSSPYDTLKVRCDSCNQESIRKDVIRCLNCKKIACSGCRKDDYCKACIIKCYQCLKEISKESRGYQCVGCWNTICLSCLTFCCRDDYCEKCYQKHKKEVSEHDL